MVGKVHARTRAVAAAAALAVMAVTVWSGPQARAEWAPRAPKASSSYYVKGLAVGGMREEGCSFGRAVARRRAPHDSLVVLAFGMPMTRWGHHGASTFTRFEPTFRIRRGAVAFAAGYAECAAAAPEAHLTLALGTSNYGRHVTNSHGRAWARMVNRANEEVDERGIRERVDVYGANDIEPGWSSPARARAWVRGYRAEHRWPFYDFGGAAGCPPFGNCQGAWTMEDVWYVAWGSGAALPLPEIYTNSGASAEQWYRLALYSFREHGERMDIHGVMTQRRACWQERDRCRGARLAPPASWRMLWRRLNSDRRTAQDLRFVTDIRWAGR